MRAHLLESARQALAEFANDTRLYELTLGAGQSDAPFLLVEAFLATDAISAVHARDVIVLCTDATLSLSALRGQMAHLEVSLASGSRTVFSGLVSEASMLGSNGGFARYRLRLRPWLWQLSHVRNSRIWQDHTVMQIVDAVLARYAPARWRWSDDTAALMADVPPRSYCCQYRETDLDFIERLLTEEGLAWRMEPSGERADGECVVLFADSVQPSAVPFDAGSGKGGAFFHAARAGEHADTVQALQVQRALAASLTTVLSYDYKAKQAVSGSSPSRSVLSARLPVLESFDAPGAYAFADADQARRYADLAMQAQEARARMLTGRSTLRTLRAGTRLTILGAPLRDPQEAALVVTSVMSVGVNNLPAPAVDALAELLGPIPELLAEVAPAALPHDWPLVVEHAFRAGYANWFEAVPAHVVWRPVVAGTAGVRRERPTAGGAQTAIVVGADGADQAQGADELHCDRLGRVRVRFHWQDDAVAGCWIRVAQRSAGGGMGSQFLPRIGQEVLVQFLENDIDRPIIVGALYNGQGEGGIAPTPGGARAPEGDSRVFAAAHDHRPSAQGNLAGGHSPVWHGASADSAGHRNAAAQWGIRTKEFGGSGYNQLLFDDTDAQGRIQLKSSFAASELNLGHLIHAADNYRGSFRGQGAELRTDAYGAVRAGAGLLISSYGIRHAASARDPSGDNGPGIAMMKQACAMAKTFHEAAVTHQTVGLGMHSGAATANSSIIDSNAAPLAALLTAVSGMVDSADLPAARADASAKATRPAEGTLPHAGAPLIAIAARGGLGVSAGQSVQLANGESVALISGADAQFVTGGQMRVHSGQAIGTLGGAMAPGADNIGLQIVAARDVIDVQAQAGSLTVQARDEVSVISANAHIDWAAAKSISLSTAGGANITIDDGNITIQCPGKIVIHAGMNKFSGPTRTEFVMPVMPHERNSWVEVEATYDDLWNTPWPVEHLDVKIDNTTVHEAASVNRMVR